MRFGLFGMGFGLFNIVFTFAFFLIFGIVIVTFIKAINQWNKNNHSPRLTVWAKVVAKRTNVSHSHSGNTSHHSTSTTYYVTFQVESGDRMELPVAGYEYGMLVEGDEGNLSFQGTRYLGFERL